VSVTMPKKPSLDFEHALKELEVLVTRMEKGDISLEESLKHFERGIELTRTCQKALKEAEQKVQILMEKDGALEALPFDSAQDRPFENQEE
jgi:exodeoxyribonuclease VII small subunit